MKFVQIMELQTSRIDEINALEKQWEDATEGKRTVVAQKLTKDRDKPNTYMVIVEFDSYEDAMRNNDLPATQELAPQMQKLCDGPPVFHNLDVIEEK
jgi:quinol monooxygenase YgiN